MEGVGFRKFVLGKKWNVYGERVWAGIFIPSSLFTVSVGLKEARVAATSIFYSLLVNPTQVLILNSLFLPYNSVLKQLHSLVSFQHLNVRTKKNLAST